MAAFKRRALGYSLCGLMASQAVFIAHGDGENGKTTEQRVLQKLLGPYARKVEPESLLSRDPRAATNDIARLRGARYIATSEVEDGKRLAESLVKRLTGEDVITARFMYKEFAEFTMAGKIWLATNYKPEVTGTDHAIWRRILLVPYPVRFSEDKRDPHLREKLVDELPGILNWLIEGCREWRESGLKPPEAVIAETATYRKDMDRIGRFLEEACFVPAGVATKASEVYRHYQKWCKGAGIHYKSAAKFHDLMERDHRHFRTKRSGIDVYASFGLIPLTDSNVPFSD
jgi:putative DNA primase/helicase